MRAFKVFLVLALVGGSIFILTNQASRQAILSSLPNSPKTEQTKLAKGTEVELMLLTALTSGGSKEGTPVTFVVAKDVKDEKGRIVIPQGEKLEGKVTRSRGGTAVASLINQPARLEVSIGAVKAGLNRAPVKLTDRDGGNYEFTLSNTDPEIARSKVADLWNDKGAQDALKGLASGLTQGKLPDNKQLDEVANRLGLEDTKKALEGGVTQNQNSGQSTNLADAITKLQAGDIAALSGVDLALAGRALNELNAVARGVDRQLRGQIKGRNIEANIGTPLILTVSETVTVTVPVAAPKR